MTKARRLGHGSKHRGGLSKKKLSSIHDGPSARISFRRYDDLRRRIEILILDIEDASQFTAQQITSRMDAFAKEWKDLDDESPVLPQVDHDRALRGAVPR